MKFEEAFDLAYDKTPREYYPCIPGNGVELARMVALVWSIIAEAVDEDGKIMLDNTAYIDDNMNIVSIPMERAVKVPEKAKESLVKASKTLTKAKTGKAGSKKTKEMKVVNVAAEGSETN